MNKWTSFQERAPNEFDFQKDRILLWHAYQGAIVAFRDDIPRNRMYTHWMRIPVDGWIDAQRRLPRQDDADDLNCVLIMDEEHGAWVSGWHQVEKIKDHYAAWQQTPRPPDNYKEIKNLF